LHREKQQEDQKIEAKKAAAEAERQRKKAELEHYKNAKQVVLVALCSVDSLPR
jgi:hypothetical protein